MHRCFFPIALLLAGLVACGPAPRTADAPAEPPAPATAEAGSPAPEEVAAEEELLPNAVSPEEGLLLGGQPSADQLDRIAEAGFATVVNLRGADEEGQLAPAEYEERGLEYIHLPVTGAADVDDEHAARLGELIDDESKRPLVVHCGSGNRVGALIALDAYNADGASAEEALRIGLDSGLTRLEPVVRERLGLPAQEPAAEAGDTSG